MHGASDPQQALEQSAPRPLLRTGFGLRVPHYEALLRDGLRADIAEAISENFMARGGRAQAVLERVRRDTPIALHGVSMSIGGVEPLHDAYLQDLAELARQIEAESVSDHLCFGSFGGHFAHDLWPLPYTEEALDHVVSRVQRIQDRLQRQILIENVASYVEYQASALSEWQFLSEVAVRSDALLLLDLNNVFVNAQNHGFSAQEYLLGIPKNRVRQLHLAGHSDGGGFLLDDHGSSVSEPVWLLFEQALARFGPVPTIIEWDLRVPELATLSAEAERARERGNAEFARLSP